MYWCLRMAFIWFSVEFTPQKFNKAPEKLPSQKEHSLPTILLQGQNLWNIRGVKLVFPFFISATLGFGSKIRASTKSWFPQPKFPIALCPPKTKTGTLQICWGMTKSRQLFPQRLVFCLATLCHIWEITVRSYSSLVFLWNKGPGNILKCQNSKIHS